MFRTTILLLLATIGCSSSTLIGSPDATHIYLRVLQDSNDFSCQILADDEIPRKFKGFKTQDELEIYAVNKPAITQAELDIQSPLNIVEMWGRNRAAIEAHVSTLCGSVDALKFDADILQEDIVIRKIVDGGNQTNRIDVVFMGDGYTLEEREAFFSDIARLTTEMFQGETFRSYLPLFNIWAIHVPSVESGIGYNGAKNTAFRLYRSQGQLRGILTGNAAYVRQVCAMTGSGGCDYPSLIGNDDYYGGLGGEFVISTKSARTGTVVLRHEMGHNFVNVGEEYDYGGVYRGVNSASSINSVGWSHWLTHGSPPRIERAIYRLLEYPWLDLWENGIQVFNFTSDGSFSRWSLTVSVSAAGEAESLEFTLDGQVLPWTSSGYDDREFYDWSGTAGLSDGRHSFTVRSKTPPTNDDIPRMICSIRLHEFGNEDEFHADNDVISVYPTWDNGFRVTFRPTNNGCLMRNMTFPKLCPVCKEGMWYQFLTRIQIIDGLEFAPPSHPDAPRRVTLHTLKLGQLRDPGNEVEGETLQVRWFRQGVEQEGLRNLFEIDAVAGAWSVEVRLITPEVRNDPSNLLIETENFTV